jgi:hypothetical protein
MISLSHFAFAVAFAGGQATVTDRLVYVLFTWWDGPKPSCFAFYWFHLWLNLRLPPDADGKVQNAAGISLDYFRSVSLIRLLFLSARRSIFHPGFSRAASVAFAVAVSSRSKNLTW